MQQWIPANWPCITPRLFVREPEECAAFLKVVFDARGDVMAERPTVLDIGGSKVMVSGTGPREATRSCLYVYVPDVDAAYERALRAGAASLEAPADMPYGDRRAMVKDPWENDWQIATYRGS